MTFLSQRLGLTRYEADEYYSMALDFYQKGSLGEAIDNVGFAITLLPLNSEYHAARGLFFLEDGVENKARENFEHALKLHPAEVLANYGMGMLAFREKKWEEALRWFNTARAVNPTQAEIPYYIALIYHRQQDNTTAKIYMEQALQIMEDANDKRRADARRWVREFEKLIKDAREDNEERPQQRELPLGVSVTRQGIDAAKTAGSLGSGDNDSTPGASDEDDEDDTAPEDDDGDELK